MSAEVGLTDAEARYFNANLRQNLGYAISPIIAETLCGHVARIKADAIAQERVAWVAKIEALADEWDKVAGRHFAAKDLRTLLPPDATAALDTVREQAKTEALRELADDIDSTDYGWTSVVDAERFKDRLRARAADTEAGR